MNEQTVISPRPFADLRSTGLLWLINTSVLHPRGYALALHYDDDGNAVGWSLLGDGTEAYQFDDDKRVDECFNAIKELMP